METTSAAAAAVADDAVTKILVSRGWFFRDIEPLQALIRSLKASPAASAVDHLESELRNMDLRSFGGASLPEPPALRRSTHLQGPMILQVDSARDICRSSTDVVFHDSSQLQRRLLCFRLTDGCSIVTAIEYARIPSLSEDIMVPGTKVRLENKVPVHGGIICLNPKSLTILGGLVHPLYEEWKMSQKYSVFSRPTLRPSQNDSDSGPPSFERLRIHDSQPRYSHGKQADDLKVEKLAHNLRGVSLTTKAEDKPSSSEVRPKEVSEAIPVQNQAAAQKLLQKMSQPAPEDRYSRGHKHRFRGKQEEAQVFTLEEWEKRKSRSSLEPVLSNHSQDVSNDEELARQLQNQFDLEDFHVGSSQPDAEQIRTSMFHFGGPKDTWNDGERGYRGRGRGRGRGRKRF